MAAEVGEGTVCARSNEGRRDRRGSREMMRDTARASCLAGWLSALVIGVSYGQEATSGRFSITSTAC